jgi:hypothetical protein
VSSLGCGSDEEPPTLRISAIYGVFGAEASPTWREVLQLAVDDVNDALDAAGEDRYRFELAFADTGNDEEVAPQKADEEAAEGTLAIIGSSASDSLLISEAMNYDDSPIGVTIICANCASSRINDAAREDDDAAKQATARDADEWMFRTFAEAVFDVPVVFDMFRAECPPRGDCNGDNVFKVAIFNSNSPTGGGFRGDVQDYMAEVMQPEFDADPACEADPSACMRGIVENVQYDRDAPPEEFDFATLVTHLLDSENHHEEGDEQLPDPTDTYPTDFITGQALASFEAGISIELAAQGADLNRIRRRANFRSSLVLERAGEQAEGSLGLSAVVAENNLSGDYLLAERGILQLADANHYDAVVLALLATIQAAQALDDPTQVTRAAIRDNVKLVNEKTGSTVAYAGPTELAKAIDAIQAGQKIDYDGASGPVDFSPPTTDPEQNDDAGGNVLCNLEEFTVIDGAFVPGDLFDCVSADCARTQR